MSGSNQIDLDKMWVRAEIKALSNFSYAQIHALIKKTEKKAELFRIALEDADDYLTSNNLNSIGSGSQLHRQFNEALNEGENK